MNPTTGRTRGRGDGWWKFSRAEPDGEVSADGLSAWAAPRLIYVPADVCKHCPHADRLRLRRVPKWLRDWHDVVAPQYQIPRVAWPVQRRSPPQGVPF